MMKFCAYCNWWDTPFTDMFGERIGLCENPNMASEVHHENVVNEIDDGEPIYYTNEHFGCVHFQKRDLRVTDLPPISEHETPEDPERDDEQ